MGCLDSLQNKFSNSVTTLLWINCLVEFICVFAIGIITTFVEQSRILIISSTYCNDFTITEIYRWATITISFVAQVYFAKHGIDKKNIFDMKTFLALSILTAIAIFTKFAVYLEKCNEIIQTYVWVLIIFVCVLIFLNQFFFYLAYIIVKDKFLSELMLKAALTEEEQRKYNLWSEIKALVSLNTIFQFLVLVGYFMFYDYYKSSDDQDIAFYIIDGIVLTTFFIISRIGYVALVSVDKIGNLNTYLIFGIVLNIYEIVRWFMLITFAKYDPHLVLYFYSIVVSQGVATVFGVIIQFFLVLKCVPFVKIGNEYLRGYYGKDRSGSSWGSSSQRTYSDMFESGRRSH